MSRLTGPDLLAHLDVMRREAQRVMGDKAFVRIGEISSYDPVRYQAKCLVYPEKHETGWLAIGTKMVGSGYGMLIGPTQGDLVLIHFADGDYNMGIIGDGFFTNAMAPPSGIQSGEVLILHSSGSYFKLPNSGDIEFSTPANANLTVGGNLTATVTGNVDLTASGNLTANANGATITSPTVTVDGNLDVSGAISFGSGGGGSMTGTGNITLTGAISTTGDVVAGTISLTNHLTTGVTPGSGESGPPTG